MNRRMALVWVIGGVLGMCGCQGETETRKPTFSVTGKVLDGSKPLANATVVFHPAGENGEGVIKPRGKTDENGVFRLTTYDANDGAPEGKYQVTIELWATVNSDEGPVNRVGVKYSKPETSGLTADVSKGPNELQPFTLGK